jgi:hypothetical protein
MRLWYFKSSLKTQHCTPQRQHANFQSIICWHAIHSTKHERENTISHHDHSRCRLKVDGVSNDFKTFCVKGSNETSSIKVALVSLPPPPFVVFYDSLRQRHQDSDRVRVSSCDKQSLVSSFQTFKNIRLFFIIMLMNSQKFMPWNPVVVTFVRMRFVGSF